LGRVDAKHFDQAVLDQLLSILTGATSEHRMDEFICFNEDSEDGPWVTKVPDRLVDSLAALNDSRLAPIAREWAESEELSIWLPRKRTGGRPTGGILARLFGRGGGTAVVEEQPPVPDEFVTGVREVLQGLRDLARKAKAQGKQLLMWQST
jgi:hypothetical protein